MNFWSFCNESPFAAFFIVAVLCSAAVSILNAPWQALHARWSRTTIKAPPGSDPAVVEAMGKAAREAGRKGLATTHPPKSSYLP